MQKEQVSPRHHSLYLLPLIENILKENNCTPQDINEIIVINGPGSFTGVRLGVTVAKTLAYTLKIPIKPITTIEAMIISDPHQEKRVMTIPDTKGVFFGITEKGQLISEIEYLIVADFKSWLMKQKLPASTCSFNIEAIAQALRNETGVNPHTVKPIYIKMIEVLK